MRNAFIDAESIRNFVTQLEDAYRAYRSGAEKGDMPAARRGALLTIAALVKLAEGELTAAEVSERRQEELFLSVRAYHHSGLDLNYQVQHPRLLQPMPVDHRPPTAEFPEVMWRSDLGAACQLWTQAHRGSGKSKNVLADEVAHKFSNSMQGKSVRQYRRIAVSGTDRRMAERYREMLRLAETQFPGEPARAAEALIESAKTQFADQKKLP